MHYKIIITGHGDYDEAKAIANIAIQELKDSGHDTVRAQIDNQGRGRGSEALTADPEPSELSR